ncbi:MAG: CHAT domain-containing protein [Planctomycetota bacterium]
MLTEWRGVPIESDGTGFLRIGTRLRVVGELIQETLHLDGPESALQVVLEAQCCTTLARRAAVEFGSVDELKAWLRETQSVAWVVVPAWHESHVFVVDGSSVTWSSAPCAVELRDASRRYIDALAAVSSLQNRNHPGAAELRAAKAAGDALAKRIMPPEVVAGIGTAEHAFCVGSGLIGGFPVSSLPLPGGEGKMLGEAVAVSVTSSLPLVQRTAQREAVQRQAVAAADQSLRNRVMLAATLTPGEAFAARNRLSIDADQKSPTGVSWTEVVSALPANTVRLLGPEATIPALRSVLQAREQPFSLAVLVAHGEAAGRDREAALGLSPSRSGAAGRGQMTDDKTLGSRSDGVLTSSELATLPMASAVVLASCRSGLGTSRLGDDAVGGGLAGACLEAGSVCVVASRVPQRLSLFRRIAVRFSEELLAGVPAAEALRRARLASSSSARETLAAAQVELFGGGQFRLAASPRGAGVLLVWVGGGLGALVLLLWFRAPWFRTRRARSASRRS